MSPLPDRWSLEGPAGAPLVVLANSLGTSWAMWDAQVPRLVERFQVLRYEHPGHGGSATPTPPPATVADLAAPVLGLLDHVGAQRASLVGLSLGGMVATWMAAHHPERVDRLVLACTSAHLPTAEGWAERAALVRAEGTGGLVAGLLGRWFTPGFTADHPGLAAEIASMLASADPGGYAACCDAIGAMDQRADLPAVTAPTLVLAGAADPVTPPAMALELAAGIAGARLVVLPGASHLAPVERAEEVTDEVLDHLAGTVRQRGRAMRRAVLGDAHVDAAVASSTPFDSAWGDLITRLAWGEVWTRPGLDRTTRSAVTVAVLTALGRREELALHLAAAAGNGLDDARLAEVLLHTAVYAGVPASNAAFAMAKRMISERDGG